MSHIHHWLIEKPNRDTSIGKCKGCPAEKEFSNLYAPEIAGMTSMAADKPQRKG
jgi:hypothetical protein